jgi:hypothetical protein
MNSFDLISSLQFLTLRSFYAQWRLSYAQVLLARSASSLAHNQTTINSILDELDAALEAAYSNRVKAFSELISAIEKEGLDAEKTMELLGNHWDSLN